jgi:hypothetical protein
VHPVRSTTAGDWFLPSDGGAGSLLRVAEGIGADAVRRVRDLGLHGLLPIGNVVAGNGQVWLRTPQPPGPTLDEALRAPLTGTDAVVVVAGVVRVLAGLHARGLAHGHLDGEAVLLDPDGAALVVMLEAQPAADPAEDAAVAARLARAAARAWCEDDPVRAVALHRCATLLEGRGPRDALEVLGVEADACHEALRRLARSWAPHPAGRG